MLIPKLIDAQVGQMGQLNDNDVTHVNETNDSQIGQMKQLSEDNVSNDAGEHYYADTQTDAQVGQMGQMNDNDGTHMNETNDSQMGQMKQLSEDNVSNDAIKHSYADTQTDAQVGQMGQ